MLFQHAEAAGRVDAELPGRPRAARGHQQGAAVQPAGQQEAQLFQHKDRGAQVRPRAAQQPPQTGWRL